MNIKRNIPESDLYRGVTTIGLSDHRIREKSYGYLHQKRPKNEELRITFKPGIHEFRYRMARIDLLLAIATYRPTLLWEDDDNAVKAYVILNNRTQRNKWKGNILLDIEQLKELKKHLIWAYEIINRKK